MREAFLGRREDLKKAIDHSIPSLFDLSFEALNYLDEEFDFQGLKEEISEDLNALQDSEKFAILKDNIRFAVRTKLRVQKAFLPINKPDEVLSMLFPESKSKIDLTYEHLVGMVALLPQLQSVQNIIDFLHSSLRIEYVLISLSIICENQEDLSKEIIDELATIVGEEAQEFYALSKVLGVLPKRNSDSNKSSEVSFEFRSEQQNLADQGIEDFLNSIE